MIDPFQCRAARAYLGWSQDELQGYAGVAKKTIADFERDMRYPHERTLHTLEHTFIAHGIEFIPQNGGGSGIRMKKPLPRLFRRDHVVHRDWIAFAFDYRDKRVIGFIECDALASISLSSLQPVEVFDREKQRILMVAADKADRGEFDPEGRVLLRREDIEIVEFDPEFKVSLPN